MLWSMPTLSVVRREKPVMYVISGRKGTGAVTRMFSCSDGGSEISAYHAPSSPVKSNFWPEKPVMCGSPD